MRPAMIGENDQSKKTDDISPSLREDGQRLVMKCSRKLTGAGVALLVAVCIAAVFLRPNGPVSFPVPSPNGYQDFIQAAKLLKDFPPAYTNRKLLRLFVSRNSEVYAIVRKGLEKDCGVPIEVSKQWFARHRDEVALLKRLTHVMIAKAWNAELEGQTGAALEAYREAYRFAAAIGHGGLALDFLNSISCRTLVLDRCQSLIPLLTAKQRAEFLDLIQACEAEQESPAAVARRSARWNRAVFPQGSWLHEWWGRLREAWRTRSWAPLRTQLDILAKAKHLYDQKHLQVVRGMLAPAEYLENPATNNRAPRGTHGTP